MKQCTKCSNTKELSKFKIHKVTNYVSSWCKDCHNESNRLYRAGNPAQKRKDQRLYRKRHPAKIAADNAKRDADKIKRTPKWLTKDQIKEIKQFYIDSEYLTLYTRTKCEVDHIIPLKSKIISGLHVPSNLQILTAEENNKKSNRI